MGLSLAQADEHARQLNMFAGWAASYFLPMTPEREVEIAQSYAIDRTEVPNEDYEKFVAATQRTPPPSPQWDGPRAKKGFEKHPVTHVTYRDARDYAEWAGKRLPTEAEWERAARGTDGRLWPWGNAFDNRKAHVFGGGRGDGPLPVGSVETDLSPVGCVDMAGNVREWTADRYEPYPDSKADPKWFQAGDRVVRGGCFAKGEGDERFVLLDCSAVMRISRNAIAPPAGLAAVGFRCAKTLGPAPADKPK
jgi:formylglycine-generating enzyme required for sulfatase activity